jgi:hypothetical protein
MNRRALVVGISTCGNENDLDASVADTDAMASVPSRHKDGDKNFDCLVLADQMKDGTAITRPSLRAALQGLFDCDGEILFSFSGHGFRSRTGGFPCTSDATKDNWGIPMQEVVDLASQSHARQILLILE